MVDDKSEIAKKSNLLEAIRNPDCGWFYRVSADDFQKIPGSPIAYWLSEKFLSLFSTNKPLFPVCRPTQGLATGDNGLFVRNWFETGLDKISFNTHYQSLNVFKKWFPYNKGGEFRRWYGNHEYIVNWEKDGKEIRNFYDENGKIRSRPQNLDFYFKESVSWSKISSGKPAFRYFPKGFIFDVAGTSIFTDDEVMRVRLLGYCNSIIVRKILEILSPTLNFEVGHIASLPFNSEVGEISIIETLKEISKFDWDSYETSWDFTTLPLIAAEYRQETLADSYRNLRIHWNKMTLEMQRLEEENNRIFIKAYGLEDELTPEVPLKEITLTCNPHYRFGGDKTTEELEALLLADTMKEYISYAVGCMFGRYSLDKPGLVLANQGETYEDYCNLVPSSTFPADEDNVLPILDGEWFSDDIVGRFKKFLKVTFGEEHYEENLRFIEEAIGRNIRTYFLNDFYNDHVKRYKKRPIYWMFSSPNGGFNALIYMHRYKSDTVSIVRSNYLVDYISKISYRIEHLQRIEASVDISKSERTKALKELTVLRKRVDELNKYEKDILFPLAASRVEIDLDDGVKVNYPKIGKALKNIVGLEAKDDEE